jgi:tRNA (guanine37-N1)-methyltransferase
MHFGIVSLFPEWVFQVGEYGVVGRARDEGLISLFACNPRDFAGDVHRTVDDRPYGGGPGMVLKYEPLAAAVADLKTRLPDGCPVVSLSPQGRLFDQALAQEFAALPGMILLAGRYEGIDERVVVDLVDEELSLGDFVLSGGEIAAMAVIDAVTRLLPAVLGDAESAQQDSFMQGLLDHPHYTRPDEIGGHKVPAVLLSGDHVAIERWRKKQALGRSYLRRPDLLRNMELDREQRLLLDEFLQESGIET